MKKQLFINESPLISGYSFYGGLFSILRDNQSIMPWVYSNFIQLKYLVDHHIVFFDRYRGMLEGCPFFNHFIYKKSMLSEEGKESLVNFIKGKIAQGAYCFLYIDRFYVPFYKIWFQKTHYLHEMLIYGYDDEKGEFLCADNGDNGIYTCFTCTFSELSEGYWSNDSGDSYFENIHYVQNIMIPEEPCMFNYGQVKSSLECYMNSIPMINETEEFLKCRFGFDVHREVLENQREKMQNNSDFHFDFRQVYLLIDHKVLMKMRTAYLSDNGYLAKKEFDKKYEYLADRYRLLLSISMKYNMTKEEELIQCYFDMFEELIAYERNALEAIMEHLV